VTFPIEDRVPILDPDGKPTGKKRAPKDLNEVRVHFGAAAVAEMLRNAKPYPVRGLYHLSDYPDIERLETYQSGYGDLYDALRLFLGAFVMIGGIPSMGKSVWAMDWLCNLALQHGWRIAICSPEMPTVPVLRNRLRRKYLSGEELALDAAQIARADRWIDQTFSFIDTDSTGLGDNDSDFTVDWLLDRARDAVLRDGINVLLIDPWNELAHAKARGEDEASYISRMVRKIKRFCRMFAVTVMVVAHPTKDVSTHGRLRRPSLYDIAGGAMWYNKADLGLIVHRDTFEGNATDVYVEKVKFEEMGTRAKLLFAFDRGRGAFAFMGKGAMGEASGKA
jgi:twinkle protein